MHLKIKLFSLSYHCAKALVPPPSPQAHPYPGAVFLKIESLHPGLGRWKVPHGK